MTVIEVYNETIKPMPIGDRITLARMILNDIPPNSVVDIQDGWSEADLADFTAAGWQNGVQRDDHADGR